MYGQHGKVDAFSLVSFPAFENFNMAIGIVGQKHLEEFNARLVYW